MTTFALRYLGWVRQPDRGQVRFRISIDQDGQPLQLASVAVDEKVLASAELDPPDDQLGTALVLEVAPWIQSALAVRSIPLAGAADELEIPAPDEARVRELIAADDASVVHAGGQVVTFDT